jgi:hypothetical protein
MRSNPIFHYPICAVQTPAKIAATSAILRTVQLVKQRVMGDLQMTTRCENIVKIFVKLSGTV